MPNKSRVIFLIIILILIIAAGLALTYFNQQKIKNINGFEACAAAGYPILETYPAQCKTPDGRLFTQKISDTDGANPGSLCENKCGDGTCQQITCRAQGCPCAETKESCPQDCGNAAIANPASIYCKTQGGKVEIETLADSGQIGYCITKDKTECEEWAYFRNECSPGQDKPQGILEGHVTVGPICPVQKLGEPCPVPASAYTLREVIIYKEDGQTPVGRQHFDANGNYSFELAPGIYVVNIPKTGGLGSSKDLPKKISIQANEIVTLDFDIDTGIR